MDESHRPVKLRKVVLGFPCGPNQTEFKFDLALNYKIANIIQTYAEQKPALVVGCKMYPNCMLFMLSFWTWQKMQVFGFFLPHYLKIVSCSFALQGKELSSQPQFWLRMLDSSWASSTSKGLMFNHPQWNIRARASLQSRLFWLNLCDLLDSAGWWNMQTPFSILNWEVRYLKHVISGTF